MGSHARYITGPLGKQMRPKVVEFLHVTLAQEKQILLHDITLDIYAGESVAILSSSEVEKNALLACVQGHLQPGSGSIRVLGALSPLSSPALQQQMGRMPLQIERKSRETVASYLQRFATYHAIHINTEQMRAYCTRYEFSPDLPVSHLDNLQARLLALALALVHDPQLVLLAEPLTGLTEQEMASFWPFLQRTQREGRTLLATCTPPLAENYLNGYDVIMRLEQGRLLPYASERNI